MKTLWMSVLALGLSASALGCGVGAVGDSCGEEGATDSECEDGAICGKNDATEATECLKICADQADCAANEDCNGVSNSSTKGCRPKAK